MQQQRAAAEVCVSGERREVARSTRTGGAQTVRLATEQTRRNSCTWPAPADPDCGGGGGPIRGRTTGLKPVGGAGARPLPKKASWLSASSFTTTKRYIMAGVAPASATAVASSVSSHWTKNPSCKESHDLNTDDQNAIGG